MFYLYQQPVNCVPDTGERLDRGHTTEQLPHPLPYICDTRRYPILTRAVHYTGWNLTGPTSSQ